MVEIPRKTDRRTFLKLGISAIAGLGAAETFIPIGEKGEDLIRNNTNFEVGNASERDAIEENCKKFEDPAECLANQNSGMPSTYVNFTGPITEEVIFRAGPSTILSIMDKEEYPLEKTVIGKRNLSLSRREILFGAFTSILFGLGHNFTEKGFDTKTIPAYQTVAGAGAWYLQRKLGIVANTVFHCWNNIRSG